MMNGCPPFSRAGKRLGSKDERFLLHEAVRFVDECRPKAVLLENVRGLMDAIFIDYREQVEKQLKKLGYVPGWKLINASDYGVSQLRPRVVFVGLRKEYSDSFEWPKAQPSIPRTVGELLFDLMSVNGWIGARAWKDQANAVAPTIVGGSKKHGGPDLGPSGTKKLWAAIGVDAWGILDEPPDRSFKGIPKLTPRMIARIQGFPDSWFFAGRKTAVCRQIGNAFPPPVACAIAKQIAKALTAKRRIFKIAC